MCSFLFYLLCVPPVATQPFVLHTFIVYFLLKALQIKNNEVDRQSLQLLKTYKDLTTDSTGVLSFKETSRGPFKK